MLLDYKFSIIKKNNVPTLYVDNKLLKCIFLDSKIHTSLSLGHYHEYFSFAKILSNVAQYNANNPC